MIDPVPNRVLVIEDNPAARYALCRALSEAGMKVTSAAHAEAAMPLWTEASAMLVDVHLPGMSGLEFCRRVRRSDKGAGKRVVLFSSLFDKEADVQAGLAAGADLYVPRPAETSELARLVIELMSPKKAPGGEAA
nr:response regulator [Ramlibacter algicola]